MLELEVEDEPNENVGAPDALPEAPPAGELLAGTAAPKENAVEGEVEGGLALKENPPNGFAGVDVDAGAGAGAGVEGLAGVGVLPKLNPVAAVADSFGAASSFAFVVVGSAPKLNDGLTPLLSSFFCDGSDGAPKLNPPADAVLCTFSFFPDSGAGALPKVNGEEDEPEPDAEGVGVNPVPAGVEVDEDGAEGLRNPKPADGTDGT